MIKQLISRALIASMLLLCTTTYALEPKPFKATYELTAASFTLGELTRQLTINEQGHYVYQSFSKPTGYAKWFTDIELTEISEWALHNNTPRPLKYSYDRTGDKNKKKRNVRLSFDWGKMRVTNTINDDPWKMSIPADTLDKLLYHLAVMYDLQQNKIELSYHVADGGKLKTYHFEKQNREHIKTKAGDFITIKVKQTGSKRDTYIWCAPELGYLPVQLEQHTKRGTMTMKLIAVEGQP